MSIRTFSQRFLFLLAACIIMAVPVVAQMDAVVAKKEANLYLTNKDGEKVFSYNQKESLFVKLVAGFNNVDAAAKEIVAVTLVSDMEPEGEVMMLQETGVNTGIFLGEMKFKKSPMPFKNSKFLEVADGDKITAVYLISKDAQGVEDRTFDNAYYNGPDWVFQNTGESHIILLH